jgi:hypothetical protein
MAPSSPLCASGSPPLALAKRSAQLEVMVEKAADSGLDRGAHGVRAFSGCSSSGAVRTACAALARCPSRARWWPHSRSSMRATRFETDPAPSAGASAATSGAGGAPPEAGRRRERTEFGRKKRSARRRHRGYWVLVPTAPRALARLHTTEKT